MRVVDKQAVTGFVRGDRQSSGSDNRGVLPVSHGERERRLPRVSGGPYGIDARAHEVGLPGSAQIIQLGRARLGRCRQPPAMQNGGDARLI